MTLKKLKINQVVKMVIQNNKNFKEQKTLFSDEQGGTPHSGGSPFISKNECGLCGKGFPILNCINFNDIVWTQGNTYQYVSENLDIKKLNLDLCSECCKRIFDKSKVFIKFSQELFIALRLRGYND